MRYYDYATVIKQLSANETLCARRKDWPPTQFIKVINCEKVVVIDTALRTIISYNTKLSDNSANCWTIHEGGERFGTINEIWV